MARVRLWLGSFDAIDQAAVVTWSALSESLSPMTTKLPFNLQRFGAATCVFVALAFATHVHAFSLTESNVIAFVQPATPSEPVDETARLQYLINISVLGSAQAPDSNSYTLVFGANVPIPLPGPATFATKITTGSLPITLTTPYNYLMAKFGPDSVYYYLGGQTGTLESLFIPAGLGQNGNGLSHISLFNQLPGGSVPDGGATIVLLGGAICGLAFLRRRYVR